MKRIFWKFYDPAGGEGGGGGGTEKEAQLMAKIQTMVEKSLETRATKEEIKTQLELQMKEFKGLPLDALRSMADEKTGVMAKLVEQGIELTALKTREGTEKIKDWSVRAQLRTYIDANKDKLSAFREGRGSFGADKDGNAGIELNVRAAATMTVGGSTNSSVFIPSVQILPGLTDLYRNRPFLEDYANSSPTSSSRIVWAEKTNPQGNAAFIGEGVVKPLVSFEIITRESYAKKVADKIKVSTEMWDDVDFIASEIEKELKYLVDIKVDGSLLTGGGDGTQAATDLKGLTSFVGGYVLGTVLTTTPNNYDAIRAAIAQIVSLNFNPNYVFFNPIDGANMDLAKDSQGRLLSFYYKTPDGKIYRLTPVETNQIPVGSVLVADMSKFHIYNYKPFMIMYGWVNDDFEKNLFTIIGERRLHSFVKTNEVGAFVYDTFANIKTAITA